MTYTSDNPEPSTAIPSTHEAPEGAATPGACPRPSGGPPRETPPGRRNVDLGADTGALIAAVPAMLGFRPENSMILLGLSRSPHTAANPCGVGAGSSEVGPVIRADLVEHSVLCAADALLQALDGRERRSVIMIVVGGDAAPLVGAASRYFCSHRTPPAAAFLVTDLDAGAPWWEIAADGSRSERNPAGEHDWASGELPDPATSPAADSRTRSGDRVIPDQREFESLLERVRLPAALRDTLPDSWRNVPVGSGGADRTMDVTDVCHLVGEVADAAGDTGGVRTTEEATEVFRRMLDGGGLADRIAEICGRKDLYPALVVVSTGPRAGVVRLILTETARLSRGLLRSRALTLLSVTAWCSSGGVLGHRAAHRALTEIDNGHHQEWRSGSGEGRRASMLYSRATAVLARRIVDAAEQGRPAAVIDELLAEGMGLIEDALDRCPAERRDELSELVDSVVDRSEVSVVRSELARRAGR